MTALIFFGLGMVLGYLLACAHAAWLLCRHL
jgi:hypothetical protein